MPSLPFHTYDVFTSTRYTGNPLALVTIPSSFSPKPTQEQKQAIAREFNLSETIFLHLNDPSSQETEEDVKVDIFLTTAEIPFAGHPTIGAAWHLYHQNDTTKKSYALQAKAGRIPAVFDGNRVSLQIAHNTHLHSKRVSRTEMVALFPGVLSGAYMTGEKSFAIPVFSIVKGMSFVLARLDSLEALGAAGPTTRAVKATLDEGWDEGFVGIYFYVIEGETEGLVKIRTRMVEGLLEDPATGSAACALSAFLAQSEGNPGRRKYEIVQGVEMGRRSEISTEVVVGEGVVVEKVVLKGGAVKVMEGTIEY